MLPSEPFTPIEVSFFCFSSVKSGSECDTGSLEKPLVLNFSDDAGSLSNVISSLLTSVHSVTLVCIALTESSSTVALTPDNPPN